MTQMGIGSRPFGANEATGVGVTNPGGLGKAGQSPCLGPARRL